MSIEWNPKGQRLLTPTQRDCIERGKKPRRLEADVRIDERGDVWLYDATGARLVGHGALDELAELEPPPAPGGDE